MGESLYNLTPTLHLLITGALVAMVPLSWVWLRNPRASTAQRVRLLTLVTLFLTFDLVLFGAFTRLTDSGLGCPDWPGCYGQASPVGAQAEIDRAQSQMPTGPVTHTKAWIEMIHRYMAMAVGGLILTLSMFAWTRRLRGDVKVGLMWPTMTLVWVCVQGAFGALTVTMKLFPLIVSLHLLGGLILLGLLIQQAQEQRQTNDTVTSMIIDPRLRRRLHWGLLLLLLQVCLGAWVSTNYAVLACNTFPQCQGSWWPLMDFAQGFGLWRPLGLNTLGEPIHFEALTAIHYTHRLMAYIVFAYLGTLAWQLCRTPALVKQGFLLVGLLLLQLLTGLSNVVLDWPLVAAVLHTGGAAALLMALVWLLSDARTPHTQLD